LSLSIDHFATLATPAIATNATAKNLHRAEENEDEVMQSRGFLDSSHTL